MKNLLFKTHVFSIGEHDGVLKTTFERSFINALEKMIINGGMYVVAERNYEYGLTQRKLVNSSDSKTLVFGKAYTYEKAIKAFNGEWLDFVCNKHAEEGANLFVSNFKLNRIMAVPNNAIVLSEKALERFLKGNQIPSPDRKVIFSDYTFELGSAVEFVDIPKTENLQMQIRKLVTDKKVNFIKINTVNFYDDGGIGNGKKASHYLFSNDVLMSRDQAIRYFEGNRMMMEFLRRFVDDVYILCQ